MNHDPLTLEHIEALLADRALQGADAAEDAGLRCLLQNYPELDAESLERTAAALDLGITGAQQESLPAELANRLLVQAASMSFAPKTNQAVIELAPTPVIDNANVTAGRTQPWNWAGWLVAAVLFLVALSPTSPKLYSPQQLVQRGAMVVAGQPTPAGKPDLKGEFIWDSVSQQGYMKLSGFDVNDPDINQLQLWIFDEKGFTKDNPIDGGVFDINSRNEVLIPIKPNIKVGKPQLFAITVERPGGVMVSDRKKLIFLGQVPVNPKS